MKKQILVFFLILSNFTSSWAETPSLTNQLLSFINTQTEVQQMLTQKKQNGLQCYEFGEIAAISKSTLSKIVQAIPANDVSKQAQEYRDMLKNYPEKCIDIFFAQADCGKNGNIGVGTNGVSVTVCQKSDNSFELLQAAKY